MRSLVWFREKDLRVGDHGPLREAAAESSFRRGSTRKPVRPRFSEPMTQFSDWAMTLNTIGDWPRSRSVAASCSVHWMLS